MNMNGKQRLLCTVLVCLLLGACSGKPPKPEYEVVTATPQVIDVTTTEQEALQDTLSTKTEFNMPASEERYAWERARIFLERYTGSKEPPVEKWESKKAYLSSSEGPFDYRIERDLLSTGDRYRISCTPHEQNAAQSELAQRGAKNFARFVQKGEIDLSILKNN